MSGEVEFKTAVVHEESVWMKVRGERGRLALYIGCVYMPTDRTSVAVLDTCCERLKQDVLSFREKVLLGDFNASVGKAVDDDDVIEKTRVMLVVMSSSPFCMKWNWLYVMADS